MAYPSLLSFAEAHAYRVRTVLTYGVHGVAVQHGLEVLRVVPLADGHGFRLDSDQSFRRVEHDEAGLGLSSGDVEVSTEDVVGDHAGRETRFR